MTNITETEFLSRIQTHFEAEVLPLRQDVNLDHTLSTAGDPPLDVVDQVELVMAVEDLFGLEVPDLLAWGEHGNTPCTLRALYNYTRAHGNAT